MNDLHTRLLSHAMLVGNYPACVWNIVCIAEGQIVESRLLHKIIDTEFLKHDYSLTL